jgi:membrane associated rhomboid family serine protease
MSQATGSFPKPKGPALWLIVTLTVIWIGFAMAINWGGMDMAVFQLLIGDSVGVVHGELWRLLTAAFMHHPSGAGAVMHILITSLLVYFFVPPLEERWGRRRLFMFLIGSTMFAYAVETLLFQIFPGVAQQHWYGGMVFADAATVAWALGARGQTVRFYFLIPMRPMVMVAIMVVWHVFQLIAREANPEGMFAPFAAMAAGWLFTDSSPLRRFWLKHKLRRLQNEVSDLSKARSKRAKASHLRVIGGGGRDDDDMLH